ncbi:MAG: DUF2092 domain-containing protein [Vicinamibacteria bacterium]
MRRMGAGAAFAAVAVFLVAAESRAQTPAAPAAAAVEPAAMDALKAMGAYLRSLKAFRVEAATTDEDVLEDGQKVQYDGRATILARMPDGLRAEVSNDRFDRMFFYDGRTFTLYGRRLNLFATIAAPPTIGKLADQLDAEHGLTVPLVDLFRWGSDGWTTDGITGALDLGPASVAGTTCEQYAFRTDEVDWQIWIQKGDFPLPRKLVITTRTDEARPQHTAVFTWDLAPSFSADAFVFDPPEGAGRVVLARAAGQ